VTRPPFLKDTKNHKRRRVYLPMSLAPAMQRRVAEVEALGVPGALLFPGPAGPTRPFLESNFRSTIFIPAARAAGWEMIGDEQTARGLMRGGRPAIPYANLRHHAAMWMRKRAGYDWEDISHYLGHHSVTFTRSVYLRRRSDADKRNRKAMMRL
jgi:integrase